jgi:hypothetical protein
MNINIVVLVIFHYVFLNETIFSGVLNDKNVEKLFIKAFKNIYNDKKIQSDEKYERISYILRTIYVMERKKEILLTKQETAKKMRASLELKNRISKISRSSFIFDFLPMRY